jgi:multidrug transporter EmrE-like cation transporter
MTYKHENERKRWSAWFEKPCVFVMDKLKLAMIVVFISTFVTTCGQIFLKMAAGNLTLDAAALLTNYPLFIGCFFYGVGAIMLIVSLKYGELSVLYPIYALNFIWVSIASPFFFPTDSMNLMKWLGVAFVMLGVSAVGFGSGRTGK